MTSLKGKTFVIADSTDGVRMFVESIIKESGGYPLQAQDGVEAANLLGRLPTDTSFVIADCDLPGLNGIQLYEWLTQHRTAMCENVVLMTGSEHRRAELIEQGFKVVHKPFRPDILLGIIENAVGVDDDIAFIEEQVQLEQESTCPTDPFAGREYEEEAD